ncbi:MAG: FtsQ-type POTRA domain-containing protein [Alphaproteobacteria bacterium]|nr:FtsQ-type POTRA domain-containing protein [Alphaproteobacteria bacterium]
MRYMKQKIKSRLRRVFWAGGILLLLAAGIGIFLQTPAGRDIRHTGRALKQQLAARANLKLNHVSVSGHDRTTLQDINAVLDVSPGLPIFDVDLNRMRAALKRLPWVRDAVVRRRLPDAVSIQIAERVPVALWQNKRRYWPIDDSGQVIADDSRQWPNLLLVVGADAPKQTRPLMDALSAHPELSGRIRSAARVGGRRWTLRADDAEKGTEIYLPETDIQKALRRLDALQRDEKILDRDIGVIDLRLPDRLVIQSAVVDRKGN